MENGCSVLRTISYLSSSRLKVGSAMPAILLFVNDTKGYPVGGGRRFNTQKLKVWVGIICVDVVANSVLREDP